MRPSSTWPAARSTDKTSWCISWGRRQSRLQHPRAAVSLAALPRRRLGMAAAITTAIGPCPTWTAGVRAGVTARRRRRRRRPGGAGAAHRAAIARRRAGAPATARARAHQRRAPAARRRRAATTGGATSLGATRHGARAHWGAPALPPPRRPPRNPPPRAARSRLTRIRARSGARAPRRAAVGAVRRRQATARLEPRLESRKSTQSIISPRSAEQCTAWRACSQRPPPRPRAGPATIVTCLSPRVIDHRHNAPHLIKPIAIAD